MPYESIYKKQTERQGIKNRFRSTRRTFRPIIRSAEYKTPFYLWCMGVLLGIIFASAMTDMMSSTVEEYLRLRLASDITGKSWLRCLWVNGRFMVLLGVITYLPFAVVWLQIAMAGYGFFFGFSVQIIARIYGIWGIIGAILSYIPHNLFLLPVVFSTVTCIMNVQIHRYRKRLWIILLCMALLSSLVEVQTAPVLMRWCLEGAK